MHIADVNLVYQHCMLVIASPSTLLHHSQSPTDFPAISVMLDQNRGPHKAILMLGWGRGPVVIPRFSFSSGGTRGSEETSLCSAVLAWRRGNAVNT